jgi:hypothetical protein
MEAGALSAHRDWDLDFHCRYNERDFLGQRLLIGRQRFQATFDRFFYIA